MYLIEEICKQAEEYKCSINWHTVHKSLKSRFNNIPRKSKLCQYYHSMLAPFRKTAKLKKDKHKYLLKNFFDKIREGHFGPLPPPQTVRLYENECVPNDMAPANTENGNAVQSTTGSLNGNEMPAKHEDENCATFGCMTNPADDVSVFHDDNSSEDDCIKPSYNKFISSRRKILQNINDNARNIYDADDDDDIDVEKYDQHAVKQNSDDIFKLNTIIEHKENTPTYLGVLDENHNDAKIPKIKNLNHNDQLPQSYDNRQYLEILPDEITQNVMELEEDRSHAYEIFNNQTLDNPTNYQPEAINTENAVDNNHISEMSMQENTAIDMNDGTINGNDGYTAPCNMKKSGTPIIIQIHRRKMQIFTNGTTAHTEESHEEHLVPGTDNQFSPHREQIYQLPETSQQRGDPNEQPQEMCQQEEFVQTQPPQQDQFLQIRGPVPPHGHFLQQDHNVQHQFMQRREYVASREQPPFTNISVQQLGHFRDQHFTYAEEPAPFIHTRQPQMVGSEVPLFMAIPEGQMHMSGSQEQPRPMCRMCTKFAMHFSNLNSKIEDLNRELCSFTNTFTDVFK